MIGQSKLLHPVVSALLKCHAIFFKFKMIIKKNIIQILLYIRFPVSLSKSLGAALCPNGLSWFVLCFFIGSVSHIKQMNFGVLINENTYHIFWYGRKSQEQLSIIVKWHILCDPGAVCVCCCCRRAYYRFTQIRNVFICFEFVISFVF